jgi:UDP-glucose 4-epimerase
MRIAVTGASGMVGRRILVQAKARGWSVAATSRTPVNADRWSAWDLAEWKDCSELDALFGPVDAIIHAGAAIPSHRTTSDREIVDANVRSCLALGSWALERNIPLLFLSTSGVYAEPERAGIAEDDPLAANAIGGLYAASKRMAEVMLEELAQAGLRRTVFRPSSVYGAGLPPHKMMIKFLKTAAKREILRLHPPVDDRHDLVHAVDMAQACLDALQVNALGIFNIGGRVETVENIARAAVKVVGSGAVEIVDAPASRPSSLRFGLDCTRAADAFGYRPQVGLEEGMTELWAGIQSPSGRFLSPMNQL